MGGGGARVAASDFQLSIKASMQISQVAVASR